MIEQKTFDIENKNEIESKPYRESISIEYKDLPIWAKEFFESITNRNNNGHKKRYRPNCTIKFQDKVFISGSNGEHHFYYDSNYNKTGHMKSGYSENIISGSFTEKALCYGAETTINPGEFYLEVSNYYSSGTKYIIYLYANIIDKPKLIKNTNMEIEITDNELILLKCTNSLKSSYMGIKDYRLYEAKRKGFNGNVDIIRENLRNKGLLNNKNAITIKGKNLLEILNK